MLDIKTISLYVSIKPRVPIKKILNNREEIKPHFHIR